MMPALAKTPPIRPKVTPALSIAASALAMHRAKPRPMPAFPPLIGIIFSLQVPRRLGHGLLSKLTTPSLVLTMRAISGKPKLDEQRF
jgi:hypothetical protein